MIHVGVFYAPHLLDFSPTLPFVVLLRKNAIQR